MGLSTRGSWVKGVVDVWEVKKRVGRRGVSGWFRVGVGHMGLRSGTPESKFLSHNGENSENPSTKVPPRCLIIHMVESITSVLRSLCPLQEVRTI